MAYKRLVPKHAREREVSLLRKSLGLSAADTPSHWTQSKTLAVTSALKSFVFAQAADVVPAAVARTRRADGWAYIWQLLWVSTGCHHNLFRNCSALLGLFGICVTISCGEPLLGPSLPNARTYDDGS